MKMIKQYGPAAVFIAGLMVVVGMIAQSSTPVHPEWPQPVAGVGQFVPTTYTVNLDSLPAITFPAVIDATCGCIRTPAPAAGAPAPFVINDSLQHKFTIVGHNPASISPDAAPVVVTFFNGVVITPGNVVIKTTP